MREIHLNRGKIALVDDEDYTLVMQYKFVYSDKEHLEKAYCHYRKPDGTRTTKQLHQIILPLKKSDRVIFKDYNRLNCQKDNMIISTAKVAQQRRRKFKALASKHKGVSRSTSSNKWEAGIYLNTHKKLYIGVYDTEIEAATAYNEAAKKYFGELARLNEI